MYEALTLLTLGFLGGICATLTYGIHKVRSMTDETSDEIIGGLGLDIKPEDLGKESVREKIKNRIISVRDRLGEVYTISQKMQELQAAMDMPSQNATHSKYKNGILGELRELEEKKNAILESILKDGIDPVIRVQNEDGSKVDMKLSEFIARQNGSEPLDEGETPPTTNKPPGRKSPPLAQKDEIDEEVDKSPKKMGKFYLHRGGKKPDTNH